MFQGMEIEDIFVLVIFLALFSFAFAPLFKIRKDIMNNPTDLTSTDPKDKVSVHTWFWHEDFMRMSRLANAHGPSPSDFVRSCVLDGLRRADDNDEEALRSFVRKIFAPKRCVTFPWRNHEKLRLRKTRQVGHHPRGIRGEGRDALQGDVCRCRERRDRQSALDPACP